MTVCVYGLWHLGAVVAACVSEWQHVIAIDPDPSIASAVRAGKAGVEEPNLKGLLDHQQERKYLEVTTDLSRTAECDVVWVCFDTPMDEYSVANSDWVSTQLEAIRPFVQPGSLMIISSQIPVGFTRQLVNDWDPSLDWVCSPENLRRGQAMAGFMRPGRIIAGTEVGRIDRRFRALVEPFCEDVRWMSLESAEMTKHALNGFLALSIVYANELARICQQVGAAPDFVEEALRSDPRIGERAYIAAGSALPSSTPLLRGVQTLHALAAGHGVDAPVIEAIRLSNNYHAVWSGEG